MGQDPDAIREEIERTRMEMNETVDAIGYKADVPSRAKDAVSDKVDTIKSRVGDTAARAKDAVSGTTSRVGEKVSGATNSVGDPTPSRGEVKQKARRAAGMAQRNPLGLAIGAAALGFLAGLAAPSSRVENEKLGPVADQVKDKAKEVGQETFDRGKQVAQQAAQSASEAVKEQGKQQGQELAGSVRQSAEDVRRSASSS
jgi:gas vesicle protein